jgi:hypothetical protein
MAIRPIAAKQTGERMGADGDAEFWNVIQNVETDKVECIARG